MTVHLRILVILMGLAGIRSVTTVSKVSVKAGGSISIPCLYEPRYRNNLKYLCKGYDWTSCSSAIKTDKQSSGSFSISDDKIQRIVTVTIKDLKEQDRCVYWCAVDIKKLVDERKYFYLSVTGDTPALNVDHQEIQGFTGEEITIKCHYSKRGVIKWCRLGRNCVTDPSGSIDGTEVTIDRRVPSVFTVTISRLRTDSGGWYWCDRGFQMPVHLTVTEKPTTTTVAATTLLTTTEPENPPTGSVDEETTTVQSEQQSESIYLKNFIIRLSLLIFITVVTMFIWFTLKKHKQAKAAASATATSCTESDVDVMRGSVVFNRPKGLQKSQTSPVGFPIDPDELPQKEEEDRFFCDLIVLGYTPLVQSKV
ncbi:uncharacterized protein LOC119033912 [Acanthopagrus latus]|uniref:uncharacterized protein LOC119033912 n=1 Tax=Acanthopagrus latus TaxID=8177 RepID=UPI00187C7847|nr:uncharacterized protein LOC119033912 [Acanthopagrus latus]